MIGDAVGSAAVGGTPAGGTLPPAITIFINGVNVTDPLFTGAAATPIVSVSEVVNGTSNANFALVEEDAPSGTALDVKVGHEVIIEHRTRRLFAGSIADFSIDTSGGAVYHRINAKDYSAELEKKRVAQSYADTGDPITQTIGDVITSVFNDFLSTSGLILGTIDDGPLISKINFPYIRALDALVQLANLTSGTFIWSVDYFKILTFRSRTAVPAPWEIDDTQFDVMNDTPAASKSLENYRNRQIVRGGKAETEVRTDLFEADGKQRTFTLRLPVAAKPVIRVNTVAVPPANIGIKGIDEDTAGVTWLFELEKATVSAKTAPSSGDDIEVDYIGLFPIVVKRENTGEQATRAALEIGDGIYESLEVDQELDLTTARQFGDALLDKHARVPHRIQFTTDRQGEVRAGQLLTIELTQLGIKADFVIETVDLLMVGDNPRYNIAANDGRELLEWLNFYRKIQRDPFLVRENEKLILGSQVTDQLAFTDSVVVNLTDDRIAYTADEYTAFLVGSPIGHTIENGEADGPEIKTNSIV